MQTELQHGYHHGEHQRFSIAANLAQARFRFRIDLNRQRASLTVEYRWPVAVQWNAGGARLAGELVQPVRLFLVQLVVEQRCVCAIHLGLFYLLTWRGSDEARKT